METLLLIEDEQGLAQGIIDAFQYHGYTVVHATNGNEGLILARERRPNLMLLDVMLPDIDGFEVCRTLRASGVQAPIIMLTSVSKAIGFNFGASEMVPIEEFLEKPVPPSTLLDRVKFHLAQAKRSNHASH